jgi:hypothetical protein
MLFGLKNAGATYQRAMIVVLDRLLYEIIECYIDDIIIKSKQEIDHLKHLTMVFECLRKYKLKMNPRNVLWEFPQENFLALLSQSVVLVLTPLK